jgi:lipopolysaccharide transport system ATP-binding protein
MSSDFAIKVEGLSKCYQIYDTPRQRLKQFVMPRLQRMAGRAPSCYFREFWALRGIDFEVKRGETVGIVGSNGSGKSTLLHMICGTLAPTGGRVQTQGRIAALLELGSGFNPEFTGRENVYLNGAVLGLTKEQIDDRFESIEAFADIGDFIEQPVKSYSSGMVVRLAFAVQAQSEPDILIVDEALAVGDAKFQAKCFARLKALKQQGTSILFVSHATEQIVTHCDRAIFLKDGGVAHIGSPRDVINAYLDAMFGAEQIDAQGDEVPQPETQTESYDLSLTEDVFHTRQTYNPHEYRWGDNAASILDHGLLGEDGAELTTVQVGSAVTLKLSIRFRSQVVRPILGCTIKTKEGITLYNTNSELQSVTEISQAGVAGDVLGVSLCFQARFAPGEYFISLGVASRRPDGTVVPHDRRYDAVHMTVITRSVEPFSGLFDIGAQLRCDLQRTAGAVGHHAGSSDAIA